MRTVEIERIARDSVWERELFLLDLPHLEEIPESLDLPSDHFACFLACDAGDVAPEFIRDAALKLLRCGAVSVSTWGGGAKRVHDLVDDAALILNPFPTAKSVVITTCHEKESLDRALWFFLNSTWPADNYRDSFRSGLVIVVDNPARARKVREDLKDPWEFTQKQMG